MLEAGSQAPSFSLPSTSGGDVSLDALRGKKVILYFYPKDDTPGCTKEACDFRDSMARVAGRGAEVFGVSKDSLASHERFRAKYGLPFALLTDAGNAAAKAYGAYGKKVLYGKEVEGTIRSTFLIDEQGRIERVWSPVKVEGHVDQVLEALGLQRATSTPKNGQVAPSAAPAKPAAGGPARAKAAPSKGATRSAGKAPAKPAKPAKKTPAKPARKKASATARRTPTKTIRPASKPTAKAKAATKKPAAKAKKGSKKGATGKLARR